MGSRKRACTEHAEWVRPIIAPEFIPATLLAPRSESPINIEGIAIPSDESFDKIIVSWSLILTMPQSQDNWEAIGVGGALIQTYAQGQTDFLPLLAVLLEEAMPLVTKVVRKPVRLFSSDKRIESITVELSDYVYSLAEHKIGYPIEATRVKIVRGITLKTEAIKVIDWLNEVGNEITKCAQDNRDALAALRNFMEIKTI